MSKEIQPCGGCGERDPQKRCIGCLHDFGTSDSAWVHEYNHNSHKAAYRSQLDDRC